MKMLNKKFVRTLSCAAVAVCAAAMLSVGAFAAEVDPTCVAVSYTHLTLPTT